MDTPKKKTLVLGASAKPERYSFLAINKLKKNGHQVIAVGRKAATVAGVDVVTVKQPATDIDTVTLYLNAANQKEYYDYILSLKPRRIIFNPGAENEELAELARKHNIQPVEACTLVLLSTGQF